ncbi:hypothetical protein HZS_5712 [Henneguya salminicola]|nr:hypothetical protein HZS_5712 [Henneguya salminicola]
MWKLSHMKEFLGIGDRLCPVSQKQKKCKKTVIEIYLLFRPKYKNIYTTKSTVESLTLNEPFSHTSSVGNSKKGPIKMCFTKKVKNKHSDELIHKYLIDYLFNYDDFIIFQVNCDPCISLYGYISFYGNIKIFFMNYDIKYRTMIVKITSIQHLMNRKLSNPLNIKDEYYKFSVSYNGIISLKEIFSLDSKCKSFDSVLFISIDSIPKVFYKKIKIQLKLVQHFNDSDKKIIVDSWVISSTSDSYESNQEILKIGRNKLINIKYKIYYISYGYSRGNFKSLKSVDFEYNCSNKFINPTDCNNKNLICASNPCLNGGYCHGSTNIYYCTCPSEFYGRNCERTSCCKNCKNKMDSTTNNCLKICNPGWSGINCETVSCDKISFCQNNGSAKRIVEMEFVQSKMHFKIIYNIKGAVRCVCYKGYFGRFCDHPRLKEQQIYYANIGFYITIIFLTFAWVGISVLIYVIFINNIKTESYEQNLEYDIIVAKKCAGMNIGYHNNLRFYPNDSLDETYENGENSAYSETINNSSINEIVTCESSVKEIESVILEYYQVETIPMDATNYMTADNIFLKNKNKLLCIESNTMCIYILCHLRFLKKFKKLYIKWVE